MAFIIELGAYKKRKFCCGDWYRGVDIDFFNWLSGDFKL
jgi:hypothetical protein